MAMTSSSNHPGNIFDTDDKCKNNGRNSKISIVGDKF